MLIENSKSQGPYPNYIWGFLKYNACDLIEKFHLRKIRNLKTLF